MPSLRRILARSVASLTLVVGRSPHRDRADRSLAVPLAALLVMIGAGTAFAQSAPRLLYNISKTVTPGVQVTDTILAYNDNGATQFFVDAPVCTGVLSSCSATPTPGKMTNVAGGGSIKVILKYTAGSVGTGHLAINVTDANSSLASTASITVTSPGTLAIAPKANNRSNINASATGSYSFNVTNTTSVPATISITGACSQAVTCSFTPINRQFAANEVYPVPISFTGNSLGGTGYARITTSTTGASDFAEDTVMVNPPPPVYGVIVTVPSGSSIVQQPGAQADSFVVTNMSNVPVTFDVSWLCQQSVTCTPGSGQTTLLGQSGSPNSSQSFGVGYNVGAAGTSGKVLFTATGQGPASSATNTATLNVAAPSTVPTQPSVSPDNQNVTASTSTSSARQQFNVWNQSTTTATIYDLTWTCTGQLACSGSDTLSVTANQTRPYFVTYSTGSATGPAGTVTLTAKSGTLTDVGSVNVTLVNPPLGVAPKGSNVQMTANWQGTQSFVVENRTLGGDIYTVTPICQTVTCVSAAPLSFGLGGGLKQTVNVKAAVGTPGSIGMIKLAVAAGSGAKDTGSVNVTAIAGLAAPIQVTPKALAVNVLMSQQNTYTFQVKNGTLTSDTYSLTPNCSGALTCGSANPTSVTVGPDSIKSVVVTFTAGAANTTGTVRLIAAVTSGAADTGSVNTTAVAPPSIAVGPKFFGVWLAGGAPQVQVFTVTNVGPTASFTVARSCGGSLVSCTPSTTTKTFQQNVADTVQMAYNTLMPAPGTGWVKVKVSGNGLADSATVDVNVQVPMAAVSVAPSTVTPDAGSTQTAIFTVSNPGIGKSVYTYIAACPGSATCTIAPASDTIFGGSSKTVGVTYVAGAANTSTTVALTATTSGSVSATGTQTVKPTNTTPPTATVAVSPTNGAVTVNSGQATSSVFAITNNGAAAATFNFQATCPAGAVGCTATSTAGTTLTGSTGSLPANGGQFTITVGYTGGSNGTSPLSVKATDANVASAAYNWARGTISVTTGPTPPLTVVSRTQGLGGSVPRDACLDMAIGNGASYECGDLRMAYSLPGMTVMNKARQLGLLFLSSHANATATIEADVSMNSSQTPTQIIPKLTIQGKAPITFPAMTWNPAWPANVARRITIPVDGQAMSLATGIYQYWLEISETTGGSTTAKTDSGFVTIVNRIGSNVARGWSVEGIEELATLSPTSMLWIGGDGSTRVYTQSTTNTLIYTVTNVLNRPDTLEKVGTDFKRHIPGGAYTLFNASNLHYRTVDAIGRNTEITRDTLNRILDVQLPKPPGAATPLAYHFQYQTSRDTTGVYRLASISQTGPNVVDRPTYFTTLPTGWLSRIQFLAISDPRWAESGDSTRYIYSPDVFAQPTAATRSVAAVQRRSGAVSHFGWDAGKLRADTTFLGGLPANDIVHTFCPAETRARSWCSTQPEALTNASTWIDGPRRDVGDTTWFFLNRFGAPDQIVNAQRSATTLTRSSTFPLLATVVTQPNGFTTLAYYNNRGLTDSTVAVNPYGAVPAANALTQYLWDSKMDRVRKMTQPLGDTATASWRNDNRPRSRVDGGVLTNFNYTNACNELSSVVYADASRDSLEYDALCNLSARITALHPRLSYLRDEVGRLIRTISPIDSLGTQLRTDSTVYNARDLVLRSKSSAGTDSLVVTNSYDLNGQLLTSVQKAFPRKARYWLPLNTHPTVDSLFHSYQYDPAGRKIYEGSGPYSWRPAYDQAGNLLTGKDYGTVRRTYDELNRLITQEGSDTNNLSYDARMGWLAAADNQNAQVRRSYYRNGAIKTDTLRIRKEGVSTPDFTAHEYVVSYQYDLNGRRTQVVNHLGNPTTYFYDSRTGNLGSVVDVAGLTHRFHYDLMGRLDTLVRMTGRADSVIEANRFDLASRLRKRIIIQNSRGLTLYNDTLSYDGRDKVIKHNGDVLGYSPLGQLVLSQMAAFSSTPERFGTDALGMHRWRTTQYKPSNTNASTTMTDTIYYAPGSSVINASVAWKFSGSPDTTLYSIDFLGNQANSVNLSRTDVDPLTPEWVDGVHQQYGYRRETLSQYNNENRLSFHQLQKDTIWVGGTESGWYTATETYKYDALGRRVWVRSIKDTTCSYSDPGSGCHSTDTRTIWDGSEILAEERTWPLDVGPVSTNFGGFQYGTVQYSHVGVIDQPITVIAAGTLLPYADWRGAIDGGTCATATTCPNYIFPGGISSSYLSNFSKRQGSPNWYGSLTEDQQDASGFQYKRNRYYDPVAGTFTQEDPIGLRGGYNTYAYTAGDPVNYSDPFGLCTDKTKDKNSREPSECERFAAYTAEAARRARNDIDFIYAVGKDVAGFPDGVPVMDPPASDVQFGPSGFREDLTDDKHPARHFVANFSVGFLYGYQGGKFVAVVRELYCPRSGCSLKDVYLGIMGAKLGADLSKGRIKRQDVAAWIMKNL